MNMRGVLPDRQGIYANPFLPGSITPSKSLDSLHEVAGVIAELGVEGIVGGRGCRAELWLGQVADTPSSFLA